MTMNVDAIREAAMKLQTPDKVRLAEELFESADRDPEYLRVTAEQRAELHRRLADYRKNPGGGHTWEEIRDAALSR
ncbi:MAG: addiction module protein [Pyrinomonadaceae bacterium]